MIISERVSGYGLKTMLKVKQRGLGIIQGPSSKQPIQRDGGGGECRGRVTLGLARMGAVTILPSKGERPGARVRNWEEKLSEKAAWQKLRLSVEGHSPPAVQHRGSQGVNTPTPFSLCLPSPVDTSHWLDLLGSGGRAAQGLPDAAQSPRGTEQGGEGWGMSVEGQMGDLSYYGMS